MKIGSAIRSYEDEIVNRIRELVRIRSVIADPRPGMPYGEGIARALSYMLELGESMGFTVKNVDGYAGHVEYGTGDGFVAVLVHLDTVPEGSGWTHDPLGGEFRDGLIYGRGASDNKGPAVVALYALKAMKDLGYVPDKRIRVIFGTNEEHGMTDMDYYFSKEPLPDYAFTPDAAYPIIHAEKGAYVLRLSQKRIPMQQRNRVLMMEGGSAPNVVPEHCRATLFLPESGEEGWLRASRLAVNHPRIQLERSGSGDTIDVIAVGKSAHGAGPAAGINAVSLLVDYLCSLGELLQEEPFLSFIHKAIRFETTGDSLGLACSDPVHGELTLNLARIKLDEETAEMILNVRHPVTVRGEEVVAALKKRAANNGIMVEVISYNVPLFVAPDHPLIQKLSRAYEMITGNPTKLLSIGGGTYAKKLQNRGVAFGAGLGMDTRAHQPDEFVSMAEMMLHGEICLQAMYELSKPN